jgi:hypothetical protein
MPLNTVAKNSGIAERTTRLNIELVWNKGIAALCDRRIPDEFPDGQSYASVSTLAGAMGSASLPENLISNPQSYADICDGELVWVRVSWLKSFIQQVLPLVNARFVLVTGDSDSSIPSEVGAEARVLLESSKIIHWYTQNYDATIISERISPIPIGIDFHLMSERAVWGENITSPEEQERAIKSIAAQLPSLEDRIPQVYVDFAWQKGLCLRHYRRFHPMRGTKLWNTRSAVIRKVRNLPGVFLQEGPLPRTESWRERGNYAFVLSPHGMGLDCHRTWEALALGHIVLVPSSSLDPLYAGLPVVPLRKWHEINPTNLKKWLARFHGQPATPEKLKSSYWIEQMRKCAANALAAERTRKRIVQSVTALSPADRHLSI